MNQRQYVGHFRGCHSSLIDSFLQQCFGVSLALFSCFEADVFEYYLNAYHRRGVGNALPHHACTEYAHLLGFLWGNILGSRGTTIDLVHLEKERIDHIFGLGRERKFGQATTLNAHCCLKIHCESLDCNIKNLLGGR